MTEIRWPRHAAELILTHNSHLSNYMTVAEEVDSEMGLRYDDEDWVAPDEKAKAIATNELWTLQWYPDTPVGFCVVHASTFQALIDWMNAREDDPA